jgi:hypothetical protein
VVNSVVWLHILLGPCYFHVHVHVMYFSVNPLQDMETVILKTVKEIQHIEYKYTKLKGKFLTIKNNIQY